jgi:hypothetical protein
VNTVPWFEGTLSWPLQDSYTPFVAFGHSLAEAVFTQNLLLTVTAPSNSDYLKEHTLTYKSGSKRVDIKERTSRVDLKEYKIHATHRGHIDVFLPVAPVFNFDPNQST